MRLLKKKIDADTLRRNSDSCDLELVVSFTLINKGNTAAQIGYLNGPTFIRLEPGQERGFPGDSGYCYFGRLQAKFLDGNEGTIEVIKSVTTTDEL